MSPSTMTTCGDSIVKLLHTSLKEVDKWNNLPCQHSALYLTISASDKNRVDNAVIIYCNYVLNDFNLVLSIKQG